MQSYNLIAKLESNVIAQANPISASISKVLLDNLTTIKKLTINNLAQQANCSKSAVVKFCKSLGLDGYKQLIQVLIFENSFLHPAVDAKDATLTLNETIYLEQYYQLVVKNLTSIKETQAQNLILSANLTRTARRVFLFGKGANLHLLSIFNNYLMKLNYNVFYSEDLDVQQRYAKNASQDDVCFLFSYSGMTPEIIDISSLLITNQAKRIVVTANMYSALNQDPVIILQVLNNEEVLNRQRNSMLSFMFIIMELVYLLSN